MPGCGAVFRPGWAGAERYNRLRDIVSGVFLDLRRELRALSCGARRTHQHPVAARFVDGLHDQFVEVIEYVFAIVRAGTDVRRHVLENRLLAEVEPNHFFDVRIDGFIVGDTGAHGVGERHVSGPIGAKQTGYAEQAVRAEDLRIEEVVVEPAIDHIDALRAAGRLQVHHVFVNEEVGAEDEFDAHVPGQKAVFEVGRVVLAG